MRRRFVLILVSALTLLVGLVSPTPARAEVDVYTTPGYHTVNGRDWYTFCEPYSITTRCTTKIKSTVVEFNGKAYVHVTKWVFNNMTYQPSPRSAWAVNPLGNTGRYSINGRLWRTECDTAVSGGNGCRSYIWGRVVVPKQVSPGNYSYTIESQWVFNNLVRFDGSSTPAAPRYDMSTITDAKLRECLIEAVGTATPFPWQFDYITDLDCANRGITSVATMPPLRNVTTIDLSYNQIASLRGLPALPEVVKLQLSHNQIANLSGLPTSLPKLTHLYLYSNAITTLVGMPTSLPSMTYIDMNENQLTNLTGMPASLPSVSHFDIRWNKVTSLAGMSAMAKVTYVGLTDNELTTLSGLPSNLPLLGVLEVEQNKLANLTGLPASLPALAILTVSDNPLTSFQGLPSSLPSLTQLSAWRTSLVTLDSLTSSMPSIDYVQLILSPQLTSIKALAKYSSMRTLEIIECPKITDVASLNALVAKGLDIRRQWGTPDE